MVVMSSAFTELLHDIQVFARCYSAWPASAVLAQELIGAEATIGVIMADRMRDGLDG